MPIVCCEQADVVSELSPAYFWDVVRRPIRFRDTALHLERQRPRRYVDAGPAGTLATFMKYAMPAGSSSTVQAILTPYGVDQKNFNAVTATAGDRNDRARLSS